MEKNKNYIRVPRSTTRPPRPGEIEGFHYHFLSREIFDEKKARNDIVAIDNFCGEEYGVDIGEIRKAIADDKRIIGVFGICSVDLRKLVEEKLLLIYIVAPIEQLEDRLVHRGDAPESVHKRIDAVPEQLAHEPQMFDHILKNDRDINVALAEFERLIGSAH